jgi:hypothetical protein
LRTVCLAVLLPSVAVGMLPSQAGGEVVSSQETGKVYSIVPPQHGFYSKYVDYRGIPIKAHEDVADEALFAARDRLAVMLRRLPVVVWNLRQEGVELHIIGKDQVTSDLPEHRHLKGKPYDGNLDIDQRTRGVGGQFVSCGEENLLGLPGDRYAGRDICVHEFAHAIHDYGLCRDVRELIGEQYRKSLAIGLWKGTYAATNQDEFLAELSMWYFGTHGDVGRISPPPRSGSGWLREYDPEAFRLLDDLYSGRITVKRIKLDMLAPRPAAQEAVTRSSDGSATTLRFRNRTAQELQLHWVDYQGKRQSYGTLPPGEQRAQRTYANHVWLVTDESGKDIALFVAVPRPGLAVIE